MARRVACLALLDRQLQQLEMDRALMKRELVHKVDHEFDKLRTLTLKIKAEIEASTAHCSPSPSNGSPSDNDGTNSIMSSDDSTHHVQVEEHTDALSVDQSSRPSTSSCTRGRKRKSAISTSTSAPVARKRSRSSTFTCIYPSCGKAFPDDIHLASHERIHTGVRPFICAWRDCQYDAAERGSMVKHIRTVHLKLPFKKKDQMALNITDHRDPNRWIRVNQQLINKRLTQTDISSMLRKPNSKVDKRRNRTKKSNKVYKYVCRFTGCDQSFQFSSNRIQHERAIHLKSKPYGCTWPDCGYATSKRSGVVRHVRSVHFGLPKSVKLQLQLSITDDRDPNQWVSVNLDQANRRVE